MLQWLHTKGFNGEQATTGSYAHNLYTYIEYAVGPTTGDIPTSISGALPLALNDFIPSLCLSMQNYTDSAFIHVNQDNTGYAKTGGRFILSHLQNVFYNKNWFLRPIATQSIFFSTDQPTDSSVFAHYGQIIYSSNQWNFTSDSNSIINVNGQQGISLWTNNNKSVSINSSLHIKKLSNGGEVYLAPSATSPVGNTNYKFYAAGPVNALYFNATSDIRAKENIKPLSHNMLDLLEHMQAYTFNYKECEERTIGMIAQDIQNIDIDGFSLVENKKATGENGDFMSIRESKLVYILLEAVKELSAEVKQLKERLGE